ncbi:hypothetical protein ZWY2020_008540 [Hordeum vulgare]|nr:hypothetical protein ZWY2020_008540 [Hordeum vulgare]
MAPPLVVLLLLLCLAVSSRDAAVLTRRDFLDGFIFGAGTSAFQCCNIFYPLGGRGCCRRWRKPSIWDTFTHQVSGTIALMSMPRYSYEKSTADVSADQYHHYKDDVKLMYEMGLDAYRFSITWPRLIPDGRGEINPKGLEYYNNLIDELIRHGIQPHVTIYHFVLPKSLQDEYNGLLSPRFIFGHRLKHWVTVNEPNIETIGGFDSGVLPPQRCSHPFGMNCVGGNSTTEPYMAAHHLLLAHASTVSLYRTKYQDAAAARRMNDFHIGWFMHPLVYGDYPAVMRSRVGARLPDFTAEQSKKLPGSFDFAGFNHYLVVRARAHESAFNMKQRDYYADAYAIANPYNAIQEPTGENRATRAAIVVDLQREPSLGTKSIVLQIDTDHSHTDHL